MTELLEVAEVSRRFGGLHALSDVSFTVNEGEIRAIIGPNGAGKTTLLDVITGYTKPDTGEVRMEGRPILGRRPHRLAASGLMRTFQSARLVRSLTVRENLMLGAHHLSRTGFVAAGLWFPGVRREERSLRQRADSAIDFLGLRAMADALAGSLPAGTQRLVEVGKVLVGAPKVILLDEPAAGLDETETRELADVLGAIRASSVTTVIVEHNMDLVMSVSDRVVVIDVGRVIADGPPEQVSVEPSVIAAYLGEPQ